MKALAIHTIENPADPRRLHLHLCAQIAFDLAGQGDEMPNQRTQDAPQAMMPRWNRRQITIPAMLTVHPRLHPGQQCRHLHFQRCQAARMHDRWA